ncbi:hypothetical protein [Yersinia ruckeri]|uniref:hypothetical protein n=1 Tax=Yersinia ruckeri TaxID=29486 RepID=UPI002238F31C|nr:hypothetical protein [Yersinia ruckeri]MCW6598872.1 hypothetical protein [Yersinia ruckeri]
MNVDLNALMRKCIARINGSGANFQLLSDTTATEDQVLNKNFFGFPAKMLSCEHGTIEVWVEIHHNSYRSLSNDKRSVGKELGPDRPYFWVMTPKPSMKDIYHGALDNCPLPEVCEANAVTASIKKPLALSDITASIQIVAEEYYDVAVLSQTIQIILDEINLKLGEAIFSKVLSADYVSSLKDIAECELSGKMGYMTGKLILHDTVFNEDTGENEPATLFVIYGRDSSDALFIWEVNNQKVILSDRKFSDSIVANDRQKRVQEAVNTLLEPASVELLNSSIQPYSRIFYRVLGWISKALNAGSAITGSIKEDLEGELDRPHTSEGFPMPDIGDVVEFSSDKLTDKGPAAGEVKAINQETDTVTIDFGDDEVEIAWPPVILEQADDVWIVE